MNFRSDGHLLCSVVFPPDKSFILKDSVRRGFPMCCWCCFWERFVFFFSCEENFTICRQEKKWRIPTCPCISLHSCIVDSLRAFKYVWPFEIVQKSARHEIVLKCIVQCATWCVCRRIFLCGTGNHRPRPKQLLCLVFCSEKHLLEDIKTAEVWIDDPSGKPFCAHSFYCIKLAGVAL